jgi:cell division protein FtsL
MNKKNTRKKKRKAPNPKMMAIWLALMMIFIAELLFYTWCRVQCVRHKYEIARETQRNEELIAMQDNLKVELARLKNPKRIAEIARNQLGLVTPTPQQLHRIPGTR